MLANTDTLSLTPEVTLIQELPGSHKSYKLQNSTLKNMQHSSLKKLQHSSQIASNTEGCQNPHKISTALLWAMHVAILTGQYYKSLP